MSGTYSNHFPKFFMALIAVALMVSQLFAAPVEASTKAPVNSSQIRTYQTELGVLKVKGIPKRVVTLSVAGTDAVIALGVKPVGVTISNSNQLPAYLAAQLKGVKTVGKINAPSLESIAALKPDLIVIDHLYEFHKAMIPQLSKIAPVAGFRAGSYQEAMTNLVRLGEIMGRKAQANAFVALFNKELAAAQAKLKNKKMKVLGIFNNKNTMWAWTQNSFSSSIFLALKADYAYKGPSDKVYPDMVQLSLEKVLQIDPDLLFVYADPGQDGIVELSSNPIWSKLKAVKTKKVVQVNRDLWSRSRGPISARLIVKEATDIFNKY